MIQTPQICKSRETTHTFDHPPNWGVKTYMRIIVLEYVLFLLSAAAAIPAPSQGDAGLEQVLKQMEAVGKNFHSFRARFSQKKYTVVLQEFDAPETGDFVYARAKDGSALLRQDVTKPGRRILTIRGGTATVYQPLLKQAQR